MKKFVISDVHGQYDAFKSLIDSLDSNYPDYKLYIIGDIIDRGEGGYRIYKLITSPQYQNKVKLLMGNHEKMLCDVMDPDSTISMDIYINHNGVKDTITGMLKDIALDYSKHSKIDKEFVKSIDAYYVDSIWNTQKQTIKEIAKKNNIRFNRHFTQYMLTECYKELREMTDYFKTLPLYATEKGMDKFLLVHSGFVNALINLEVDYNICSPFEVQTIEDLNKQDPRILLSCRATDMLTNKKVFPEERFCNHVIVYGHTPTANYRGYYNFDPLFVGKKLVSICLDGCTFLKKPENNLFGQINCVCLDDLSQIIIKNKAPYEPLFITANETKNERE